jgi:hypothetical protein
LSHLSLWIRLWHPTRKNLSNRQRSRLCMLRSRLRTDFLCWFAQLYTQFGWHIDVTSSYRHVDNTLTESTVQDRGWSACICRRHLSVSGLINNCTCPKQRPTSWSSRFWPLNCHMRPKFTAWKCLI